MNKLAFITYKSQFNHSGFSPTELSKIINTSRIHNKIKHITGILVFDGEHIFGYIEGRETDVTSLYQKISTDERHLSVKLLSSGSINRRQFMQWDMAYYYLKDNALNIDELMVENLPLEKLLTFIQQTDSL